MSERNIRRSPRAGRGMRPVEKPKDFKGTLKKLINYIGGYKAAVVFVALFAVGSTVFAIVGPKILGNATTELFNGLISKLQGGAGIDFDKIGGILMSLLMIYVISAVLSFLQHLIMTNVTQKITYRMRREISEKIHRLPMNFFDRNQHGEVLSLITNDVDTISMGLNQTANQFITSVTTIVGILVMMLSINGIMTLAALTVLPVSMVLVLAIVGVSQKYFKAQQDNLGHVNGQIEEIFGGVTVVQAFNREEDAAAQFEESNGALYGSMWRAQFLSGLMQPVMAFVGNLGYVLIAILGGYFAVKGRITVGNIQSFVTYTRQFTQPITQLAQVSNMMQSMTAAAERIFAFLGEDEEAREAEHHAMEADGSRTDIAKLRGSVTFENVRFGYDPEKIIIHDFSAEVEEGRKIAIVGPTGAGKTTLVKLLMRFYDINGGSIRIDGHDIREFDRDELRSIFGMVLQDTWLFSGTVRENIRYGRLDATDDEVIAAAKATHVHHFIQTLPDGYDMELNEEASNVSQGQKQLLTIARTVLADPKILILDEATSSVDTRTEVQIQRAMDKLMKGRTSFIIAHRLSTIRNADLILVLRDGDIIEQGTHDGLLAENGFYAELYRSQFEKVS